MKPLIKYAFQQTKNIFKDEDESAEKWIRPTLKSGAVLHICPLVEGTKAALHKKGPDFLLQMEGDDENLIKDYENICEDFKFGDNDFILEGYVDGDFFSITDILYYDDEDLVDKGLIDRRAILEKAFGDLAGYSSTIVRSFRIESYEEFQKFTQEYSRGYQAGIDTSLYTEGCPSNQWCAFGKNLLDDQKTDKKLSITYDKVDIDNWHEKLKKGVMGEFSVSKTDGSYHLSLNPIRPYKSSPLNLSFQAVDNEPVLKRQFEKGNQFPVGFKKFSSPSPEISDNGYFTIIKATDQSTVISFDGLQGVLKGIYHVTGSSKHNFPNPKDIQGDVVYQLSYSDANIDVDKKFGRLTWLSSSDKTVEKGMVPVSKQDDDEERFVFGEVLIPEEIDAHGDIYSQKEVRFAAHFFMERFGNTGLMHEQFINDQAVIIETFVAPVGMTINSRKIKKGTWLIGMRILSEKLFEDIKAGRLTGFSIGGIATVQELRKLMVEYDWVAAA